ncbi:minichromosome maintenance domain-containing protein 2 [Micropterus dolomieu]|uniref:minichromosome maintenance domain-containing protein 2 n=1 Tax=Micropterus dolomieu TaxID=147949 RepID=UPI001E8D3EB5|nr:minichromosome maintenance domain-containing protein 2 [Micropterus dolomieu]XP_045923450.1 minichromosome maintenance domain-containing protein 2 [Micropterus dolomieu]XP_045923459.1 minichromosome maintenance domain-containing protein 2 [Micropterus dolomieu]
MTDILSLKESVLVYLDRSGGLQKLSEDCKPFNDPQQIEAVYRFCISVNPSDVIEVDPVLGDCLLRDPLRATALFKSVCFLAIKTLSLLEKIHTESQVNVILKLTHLPPFPEYTLDLRRFPRGYGPMRPVSMEGLVIAMTRVTKYTQGARFLCINDDCPCSTGFQCIRVHAPGATESATVRNNFSCMICSSQLKEDVKFRVLGDKQLVELIHVKALDGLGVHQQSPLRYQSVTLFLRDELCNSMRIGRLYRVIGIPAHVHQWPGITWSVEANSVEPWEPENPCKVSASFQELLEVTAGSPWRFSATLANSFGLDVAPPGLYNTLKLGLLLSLVQTRADAKDRLHNVDLLVVTSDTLVLDRLMTYSLSLACRGVRHQTSGEMFASLSRDEHGAGTANIHAGSALLATGGICMLGDLGCYKKDRLDAIQSVLESCTVSVFIPGKKYGEDADQQLSLPVQCSFWALTDSTDPSSRRSGRPDCAVLGTAEMGPVPIQLADAFGLVIQCRDMVGEHALLAQTVHTLQQAVHPGNPLYSSCWEFSTQDYKELVAHARSLQVELSPGAEKIIHGYYMASRRVRTQSQGVKMSVASIKLLISLAEAHCKLCLRTRVLEEDAVIAVLLCENSVTLKHGASALVIPPDAVFPCNLGDVDGLHKRDVTLDELHQNILRFIYTYAPGADTYITEE